MSGRSLHPGKFSRWVAESDTPYGKWARGKIAEFVENDTKVGKRSWADAHGKAELYDQAMEQYNRETKGTQ